MASEGKNNTWYWVVGTIVVIGVIYFIFKEKIDRYLGIAKDLALNQTNYSCASTFYVKTEDGKTQNVWTSDEGTSIAPNVKYYKQDVTLTENGVTNFGSPVSISKEAFTSFCRYKYSPPYDWYTAKAPENTGHGRTLRTMAGGGMAGRAINRKEAQGVYNQDGTPVNGYNQKQFICKDFCAGENSIGWHVEQYPKGHPYHPYYRCWCDYVGN